MWRHAYHGFQKFLEIGALVAFQRGVGPELPSAPMKCGHGLLREGTIHNYLRMLWGKTILEWSATPELALAHLIELNNRYALDGRNPNSYSGIFWTLGRFDRPWPERKVFGTIRCMTSDSTERKLDLERYLTRFAPQKALF